MTLKLSTAAWPATAVWLRRRAIVYLLYFAALTVEEVLQIDFVAPRESTAKEFPVHIDVVGRRTGQSCVYLVPPVVEAHDAWFLAHGGWLGRPPMGCALCTRARVCDDVQHAMRAAAEFSQEQGWSKPAAFLSRARCLCLRHAFARNYDSASLVFKITGATEDRWSTLDGWFERSPLSKERFEQLWQELSAHIAEKEQAALERLNMLSA